MQVPFKKISAQLSWNRHHGYFCLGYFSSKHFDLVTVMPRKAWWHFVRVFQHDRCSHAGNCIGLPSNTGHFFSTGDKTWFLNLTFQHKNEEDVRNLSKCSSDICCLCCPTIEFCGISTGNDEIVVDRSSCPTTLRRKLIGCRTTV